MVALFATVTMSSCWDFNREQQVKDAEASGKSILVEAESSKKAKIEEAKANAESADLEAKATITRANADAEATIIRAKAKSEATRIMIERLGGITNYLEYVMIDGMYNHGETIYVPTEAGLPLLRSGK